MNGQISKVLFSSFLIISSSIFAQNYNNLNISADGVCYRRTPLQQETSTIDKNLLDIDKSFHLIHGALNQPAKIPYLSMSMSKKPGFCVKASYEGPQSAWEGLFTKVVEWNHYYVENGNSTISFFLEKPNQSQGTLTECPSHALVQNSECNYITYFTPPNVNFFSSGWMIGGRYLSLSQQIGTIFSNDNGTQKIYRVDTHNQIGAMQLGAMLNWHPTQSFSWHATSQFALGCNFNHKTIEWGVLQQANGGAATLKSTSKSFSFPFIADAKIKLSYQQPQSFLSYHISYQMMYLKNIASPLNQLPPSKNGSGEILDTPVIDNSNYFCSVYTVGFMLHF